MLNRLSGHGLTDEPGLVVALAAHLSRSIRGDAQQFAASIEQQSNGEQQVSGAHFKSLLTLAISPATPGVLLLVPRLISAGGGVRVCGGAPFIDPAASASSQQRRLISFVRPFFSFSPGAVPVATRLFRDAGPAIPRRRPFAAAPLCLRHGFCHVSRSSFLFFFSRAVKAGPHRDARDARPTRAVVVRLPLPHQRPRESLVVERYSIRISQSVAGRAILSPPGEQSSNI